MATKASEERPTKQSFEKIATTKGKNKRTWMMIYRLVDGPPVNLDKSKVSRKRLKKRQMEKAKTEKAEATKSKTTKTKATKTKTKTTKTKATKTKAAKSKTTKTGAGEQLQFI